jgi:hypothetical protein
MPGEPDKVNYFVVIKRFFSISNRWFTDHK